MMIFKPGDRVTYKSRGVSNHKWNDMTGTVLEYTRGTVMVLWDVGSVIHGEYGNSSSGHGHYHENLKLLHPQLKYDPMQQGDRDEDI